VGAQSYAHTHTHTHVCVCTCIYIYIFVRVIIWVCAHACLGKHMYNRIPRKLSSELVAASVRISNISSNLFLSIGNIPVDSERNCIVLAIVKAAYFTHPSTHTHTHTHTPTHTHTHTHIYIYIYIAKCVLCSH